MTQQEIHDSLDAMLANPKSKNFLNHLVRAYFPISSVEKVWSTPKGPFKCVLTKEELVSVETILEGIQTEEFKHEFHQHLLSIFNPSAQTKNPIVGIIGDKKLGVTGKDTNTFMSYGTVQEFYNWVLTKSLKNDKHINWLLGSIRKSSFIERAEGIQDEEVQKKIKNIKQKVDKSAYYSLGDTDAFKKLKDKFKNED